MIPLPDCGVRLDGIAQSADEKIYCLAEKTLWLVGAALRDLIPTAASKP